MNETGPDELSRSCLTKISRMLAIDRFDTCPGTKNTRLEMVKDRLEHGDIKTIAKITGYSYEMARSVLKGRRKNEIITQAASELWKSREGIAKKFRK